MTTTTPYLVNEDKVYTYQEMCEIAHCFLVHNVTPPQLRTPAMLQILAAHYQHLNDQYWTVKDYVLFKVFGIEVCEVAQDGVTKKKALLPCQEGHQQQQQICIVKNDFPYDKLVDVEQWILWSLYPIRKHFKNSKKYIL